MKKLSGNSITEMVYQELRRAIMELQLPPGTEMSTQEMALKLDVSRTPVREAFNQLQTEGLVDIIPQIGTVVSKIDLNRVRQERFLRESLELAVMEPFLNRCSADDLRRLEAVIEKQKSHCLDDEVIDFLNGDNEMHQIFFEVADQSLSWETILNANSHYNRMRVVTSKNMDTRIGVLKQHEKILNLIREKDVESLKREISDHLRKIFIEEKDLLKDYPKYFISATESDKPQIRRLTEKN